jgi:glycosyltransferase involved in cell wall biosynthesis
MVAGNRNVGIKAVLPLATSRLMNQPFVSVVIPVYNAGKHLIDALGSILDQSYTNWEMICVNDGSSDSSPDTLERFAKYDSRIQVIHQTNSGIVSALNLGCSRAKGEYICRMDSDDISMPDRLNYQVSFMQSHSEVVAMGGAILTMDSESQPLGLQQIANEHESIVANLLNRRTGLFHPASMIRASAFRNVGGYRPEYQWIEDHDLWLRLSSVGKLANTDHILLCYRQHASSVCWQRAQTQRELMNALMRESHLQRGLPTPVESELHHVQRTKANPGKWARMAARGGYAGTASKHLRLLWQEQGFNAYSLRMTAEVCLRAPIAAMRRQWRGQRTSIPNLSHWHKQEM